MPLEMFEFAIALAIAVFVESIVLMVYHKGKKEAEKHHNQIEDAVGDRR